MSLINKALIFEHFSGRTSPLQKKLIAEWLEDNPNREQFYTWLAEWESTFPAYDPDIRLPLQRFIRHMEQPAGEKPQETGAEIATRSTFNTYRYAAAAAVLILLSLSAWLMRDQIRFEHHYSGFGRTSTVLLPDGSRVTLNANSLLRVPRWTFGQHNRHVYLEGEAEFAVRHLPGHELFQVHTMDQSLITVLGTEFTVYTREKMTNVVLSKGKVRLSPPAGDTSHTMRPGEKATIAGGGKVMIEQLTTQQLEAGLAWKQHRFVFDNTPLSEVAEKIREVFGVQVNIADKNLALRTATGSFPADSADELLSNMSVMYSFEIVKTKKQIQIIPIP